MRHPRMTRTVLGGQPNPALAIWGRITRNDGPGRRDFRPMAAIEMYEETGPAVGRVFSRSPDVSGRDGEDAVKLQAGQHGGHFGLPRRARVMHDGILGR